MKRTIKAVGPIWVSIERPCFAEFASPERQEQNHVV
jgi:hypothetical protein